MVADSQVTELVTVDIGGTHARFALARLVEGAVAVEPETVLHTGDYPGLPEAWAAFAAISGRSLPPCAAIAIAGPVDGDSVRMTNNAWRFDRSGLAEALSLDALTLLNDFEAVGHAVPACADSFGHLCGPNVPLPSTGIITVVGPGTGLGVAILDRMPDRNKVIGTEGGHIAFAPLNDVELRAQNLLAATLGGRVSIERLVSGPGLRAFSAALGRDVSASDAELWHAALAGEDALLSEALDCFCQCLGSIAGDFALAHGASAVVIAGGLGRRLAGHLPRSGFAARFIDKGRNRTRMAALPVKLMTHSQPGLLGAAMAFAQQHIKKGPAPGV